MNLRSIGISFLLALGPQAPSAPPAAPAAPVLLQQQEMQDTFPAMVFFAGKTASTQLRNSGGVRSPGDKVTEFALVDASGYSSGVRERYQFYLLTSVAVEWGGKRLPPGAYGGGFLEGKALLMDLAGEDVLQAPVAHQPDLKRPRPLAVAAAPAGEYRLCLGRDYVAFRQLPE